jgi:hypothetical protein
MYILRMLDEIFYRYQLGPFDLWCNLVLEFLYWFFVWMTYLMVIGGLLKSPPTTILKSICVFKSFKVCLMKLGALRLDAYRLIIVISFGVFPLLLVWSVLLYLIWSMYVWSLLCLR